MVIFMNTGSELTEYMNGAVSRLITNALRATLKNPKETAFIMQMQSVLGKAGKKRLESEERGVHIPAFLISSITNKCNLHCKGCYARENHICGEVSEKPLLTAQKWGEVFKEAVELGIAFNLLAGGEPLLRKEVIYEAAKVEKMIFPIFTNGLMINEEYLTLFSTHRNLIPVISLEGEGKATDERRGNGTYEKLIHIMKELQNIKILYGTSITVTSDNIMQVTSSQYIRTLADLGCRLVFFIEYVPVSEGTQYLSHPRERTGKSFH
jgi:MoaA/NifB/PqqE/SkfB family radical SAM enzyme